MFDDRGKIIGIPYEAEVRIIKRWDGNTPRIGFSPYTHRVYWKKDAQLTFMNY